MSVYLVEIEDLRPYDRSRVREKAFEIRKTPELTNMSREPMEKGWLGTTNDVARYALGVFADMDAARAHIAERCKGSGCRLLEDANGVYRDLYSDEGLLEAWGANRLPPASAECSCEWAYRGFEVDIEPETTDERIGELVEFYAADFEIAFDSLLDKAAVRFAMEAYRDSLQQRESAGTG